MTHHFSIGESLHFGWAKTKAHSRLLFQAVLTVFAVEIASAIVRRVLVHSLLGFAAEAVLFIMSIYLGVGLTVITLKIARGEHASYSDLMPNTALVWRFFLAGLLSALLVVCGLILLIVPGIYLALRYSMVRFAVIDGASVTDSLRKSAEQTQGVKWHLLWLMLAIIAINIVGAILFLVPLLVTVPVTMIAYAHVYQKLQGRAHAE
ncbi:MAG TPA: hypothetical protein VMR46_03980 [Candidatus Paceibacterota bacterium]|nr:hypothetical protein [Candidatus Paceibacterota bacterium]